MISGNNYQVKYLSTHCLYLPASWLPITAVPNIRIFIPVGSCLLINLSNAVFLFANSLFVISPD
jgi:hypothetical protein